MTPTDTATASASRRFRSGAAFFALIAIYEWCFGRFFPNAAGNLGHDYSYTLPELLAGDYWFHTNGWLAVPWFTPAFCGGKPFFADPQSMYYSLAQWLSFVVDPLSAIHASLLLMAAAAFWGSWLLLRRTFQVGEYAALAGAAVFMFNGFYSTRMIVGHYTFHSLALIPLLAWLLLGERTVPAIARAGNGEAAGEPDFWRYHRIDARNALWAGLLIAYMVNSGAGSLVPMAALSTLLLLLLAFAEQRNALAQGLALRCLLAVGIGLAISAARLTASISLLSHFPRSDYHIPGFDSLLSSLQMAFEMYFLSPVDIAQQAEGLLRNVEFLQARHELEYGVTLVPAAAVAVLVWRNISTRVSFDPRDAQARLQRQRVRRLLLALLLVLLLPVLLNTFDPDWNAVLKATPFIGSSSTLLRWFALAIPAFAVLTALAVQALPPAQRTRAGLAATALVVLITALRDNSYYHSEPYPPKRITAGAAALALQGQVPEVRSIAVYRTKDGRVSMPIWRDDALAEGASQLGCYYPTFGYGLEKMPVRDLQPGPSDLQLGDHYNLKNPACYVYPLENSCSPGDHFRLDQKLLARDFVNYREWRFEMSLGQQLANAVSEATLLATILGILTPTLLGLRGGVTRGADSAA
jgi:hypothetical protein